MITGDSFFHNVPIDLFHCMIDFLTLSDVCEVRRVNKMIKKITTLPKIIKIRCLYCRTRPEFFAKFLKSIDVSCRVRVKRVRFDFKYTGNRSFHSNVLELQEERLLNILKLLPNVISYSFIARGKLY